MTGAVLAAAVPLCGLAAAPPAAAIDFCAPSERECSRFVVPLDRSGAVPGRVGLQVEVSRPRRPRRPPIFFLAGGPGQSATRAFDSETIADLMGAERRNRTVVVMDQRGTGDSDVLRCPRLERAGVLAGPEAAAACARSLGARRAFYTTREAVADIEAVRAELGAPRIAIYGASYGTKVALTYALTHPTRVERLALDSVLEESGPDPLYRESFAAAPRVLSALCRGGACRRSSRRPARDLARLAARLERRPLRGRVFDGRGRGRRVALDGFGLFSVLVAGDFDPTLRAEFPADVRNALRGDPAPLLRAAVRAAALESETGDPRSLSIAAYAAATCEESPLPWSPSAGPGERRRQAQALIGALPTSAFAPFGRRAALGSDVLRLCQGWPHGVAPPAVTGPLPRVPLLLLEGEGDVRTPVESARRVAARVPGAQLLVVRDGGHGALGSEGSGCVDRNFRRFLAGVRSLRCARGRRTVRPTRPAPLSLREVRPAGGRGGRVARVISAVRLTFADTNRTLEAAALDALEQLLFDFDGPRVVLRAGGLRGGYLAVDLERARVTIRRLQFVPGVRLSGTIVSPTPRRARGRVRVQARGASGTLHLRGNRLVGRLGGTPVSINADPPAARDALASASANRRRPRLR